MTKEKTTDEKKVSNFMGKWWFKYGLVGLAALILWPFNSGAALLAIGVGVGLFINKYLPQE